MAALRQEHRESELGYRESYRAFEPRFAALAEEHRGTEAEVSARLWLLQQTWWLREDGKMESTALPIAEDLLERHFDSPRLGDLVESHYVFDGDAKVELFERLLESPHGEVRAAAHLGLAKMDRSIPPGEEARRHLETLVADYAELPYRATTYGAMAAAYLERLPAERLEIGQLAPDIEGEDVDGLPFKLADYRGKVVLLDFWGDW